MVTRVPVGAADLTGVDAGLNTESTGTLLHQNQVATYSFTVSNALGNGEITVEAYASGTLLPRLDSVRARRSGSDPIGQSIASSRLSSQEPTW